MAALQVTDRAYHQGDGSQYVEIIFHVFDTCEMTANIHYVKTTLILIMSSVFLGGVGGHALDFSEKVKIPVQYSDLFYFNKTRL